MNRVLINKQLVVASHNDGKIIEISDLLSPYGIKIFSSAGLKLREPEEDGDTFIENAEIKSKSASIESGLVALADDSGLVVPSLGGIPGIHSARYAYNPWSEERDFKYAMDKLNIEIGNKDRSAYFVCALSLAWPDGHIETFEGEVHGKLTWPIRGNNGFGYDPMFIANGFDQTFGEMDPVSKHSISHRAKAFEKLIDACFKPQ
ncbi:MAG: RdgB/HAM1 family non-canonical purine NTP pyrophosphatase [Emcibacteraceae bacterium]|mgnify:FL=1|jgi:XTP/dITP diphosphohydrolase|nr:RdgB/HAM1 family non-canonical purine NTP pyrophosphatase [Kordiimonadaceae bacterium]|tara:strand:+ start:4302 stop:4913 length:612 start_codon:yes stop_codon:yes gene_type:complete